MCTCKKCGRELKGTDQNHQCYESPKTIDNYIQSQPQEIKLLLSQVRNILREALPHSQERISWGMPTYWNEKNIIHFAACKKHLGLYPGDEAIVHFTQHLSNYKTSKGAIQFPYNKPIPLDLISEIAKWCYETESHH